MTDFIIYLIPFFFFSLSRQHAVVILKEPSLTVVTSRPEPVYVGQVSLEPAVTPAAVDAVTPSLPAKHVLTATSVWMPRDRTSAWLWKDSPHVSRLDQEVLVILET